jgi:hypothetical protein
LASDDPFLNIPWDARSEQPAPIRHHRSLVNRVRYALPDYLKSGLTALALAPDILWRHRSLATGTIPTSWHTRGEDVREFMGLAVALHSCPQERLAEEIHLLGVKHLLLRIPVWEVDQLDKYVRFLADVPDCEVAVGILQNRENVLNADLWRQNLRKIVEACWPRVRTYQIGQGMNRSKWGFFSTEEFLRFASQAEALRPTFPGIEFAGPGVLDFEAIPLIRSMVHGYPIHWDVVSCALYVDRRGSPREPQMFLFDLKQKIFHFAACAANRSKAKQRLWITEFNWPLQNQGKFAPTSPAECVSEEEAARFLREYYEDAWETRLVERVYWWQLVARGYGLIDPGEDGILRRRPAYTAFQRLLREGIAP